MKHIIILCSLDTKGTEAQYLRDRINEKGMNSILLNTGFGGQAAVQGDISSGEVARAGGGDIDLLRASSDTGTASRIMTEGAAKIIKALLEKKQCDGVVAFGGVSNTTLSTNIMKTLPFGVPKLMVSSAASMPAYAAKFIGTADITMMHSVVDISGLNDLSRAVLERAAGGICGMAEASRGAVKPASDSPLIAVTSFKFSEKCSQAVIRLLEEKGYAVIPFHAQGMGDKAMEELIDQGLFDGVVDVVPAGVSEHLFNGNRDAGPNRLEAAGRMGIPQVVTPCGFDMLSCGPLSRKENDDPLWTARNLTARKIFVPDEFRVQARSSAEEIRSVASAVAEKLNKARGPVKVFIPTRGWSTLSVKGADLYEPESDAVFAPALCESLNAGIDVREVDTELNSTTFATLLVEALEEMLNERA
jgi:uncharacterized protein (UPF0261 family)